MFMPGKKQEIVRPKEADHADAAEDKEFEKQFLNDFPHFTAHKGDMRAIAAFRREFKLWNHDNMNIFIMAGASRDISAERIFAKDENDVVFYSSSKGMKRALEARGHEAKKMDLERKSADERADIFIMLDPGVRATKQLLHNIAPRGWVLCRLSTANSLRAHGRYDFKGIITRDGDEASISRRDDPTFWKSVEVDSEEEFRNASTADTEGVASYAEAKEKVKEAREAGISGMHEENVLESYKKLVRLAEEQRQNSADETNLSYTTTKEGVELTIVGINAVLPTKKDERSEDIIIMKKDSL
jgi:hypothetical protein